MNDDQAETVLRTALQHHVGFDYLVEVLVNHRYNWFCAARVGLISEIVYDETVVQT